MTWEGMQGGAAESGDADRFPWLVTLASLAVGLWIFFTSTVEACRERDELDATRRELEQRHAALRDEGLDLRQRRTDLPHSGDLLMVEFDRQGLLPEDFATPPPTSVELGR